MHTRDFVTYCMQLRARQYYAGWILRCSHTHSTIDCLLSVKAVTLIFISGCGSVISSAKQVKSGSIYNLVKNFKLFGPRKQTCVHFMNILTVYTLNSHLLILKAQNHKLYIFVVHKNI